MNEFDQDSGNQAPRKSSPWRRVAIAGAVAVVAMGVGAAAATGGASTFYGPAMHVAMSSSGMGSGFAERRFDRMMSEIEASDEQADRLREIFEAAREDLMPARDDFRSFRDDLAALIAAPQIDRNAAEQMRAERVEAIDEASRRMTEAFLEAAEVLTPEQRVALVEKFEERRWHGRR